MSVPNEFAIVAPLRSIEKRISALRHQSLKSLSDAIRLGDPTQQFWNFSLATCVGWADYRADVDKGELLRTITVAQSDIAGLIERISNVRLLEPVMDDWTAKDVLAHLAWWQDHSARLTADFSAKRQPDDMTHPGTTTDEINEHVHRQHLNDTPEVTRDAFAQSFQRLLAALEPLTDDDLFGLDRCSWLGGGALAEMIIGDTSRHYQQHWASLEPLSQC
jgi:hypothetical protein